MFKSVVGDVENILRHIKFSSGPEVNELSLPKNPLRSVHIWLERNSGT
jgi:hypothetical protein